MRVRRSALDSVSPRSVAPWTTKSSRRHSLGDTPGAQLESTLAQRPGRDGQASRNEGRRPDGRPIRWQPQAPAQSEVHVFRRKRRARIATRRLASRKLDFARAPLKKTRLFAYLEAGQFKY